MSLLCAGVYFIAFIIPSFPLLMVILLGNWQATFPDMDFSLCSTWRELYCVNRIALLLLVGLVVGGIDGDSVDIHASPASSSAETLTHSSSVQSSLLGFLLPIHLRFPYGHWGAPGLRRLGPIIRSCLSVAIGLFDCLNV